MPLLWKQLSDIYGARFVSQHGEEDASGVWYQTLHDLSREDIRHGLHAMLRDVRFETWPPNCTQFRHLCLSRLSEGVPNVHEAFREVQTNLTFPSRARWSHLLVKHAVVRTGLELLDKEPVYIAFAAFKEAYEELCRQVALGLLLAELPDEALLPARKKTKPAPSLKAFLRSAS